MKKYFKEIVTHPLFSGSMIMVFGSNFANFLNVIYHFIMGKTLGPANYGELAAIISLVGLLGIIPGSLNLVVIKHISSAKSDNEVSWLIHWLTTKIFVISIIFPMILLVVSPVISSFLNISKEYYLILVAVFFFFSIQSLLNRSILLGLLRFKDMVISTLAENGIKLLISALAVYLGFQVGGAMVGLVLSAILGWYITNSYLRYRTKQTTVKVDIKQMLLFTVPVLIQSAAITSLYSSDVILVKHFFSSHDAGIYASLSALGKIIFFGAGPIGAVMFPLVSRQIARGENYKKIFLYSFLATIILSIGVLLIYWLFPQFAIKLLFGTKYLEAQSLLVWFGIFISLFTLSSLLVSYGLSLGKTSIVILPLVAAVMQVAAILLFHRTLYEVIFISILTTALLLVSLLIYSMLYGKRLFI